MTLKRKFEEKFFRVLSALITLVIVYVLANIIWTIIEKGFRLYHGKSFHKNQKVASTWGKVAVY